MPTMHFQISGANLTNLARQRLLEDAPGSAWRIASCLLNDEGEGDDRDNGVADAALSILTGTKRLVGNESGMKLVKEPVATTKSFQEQVKHIYAGRIQINGRWYCPVAYVSDMGPRDMRNDHQKPVVRYGFGMQRGYKNRAWHYCSKDEIVAEHTSYPDPDKDSYGLARETIFRACNERPHWLTPPRGPQEALDEYLAAGHGLEERSHSKWYGTTSEEIWADADDKDVTSDPPEQPARVAKAIFMNAERTKREQDAIKKADLLPMNARINAELALAKELDELNELDHKLDSDEELSHEIVDEGAAQEAQDQIDLERDELYKRRLVAYQKQILEQANGDLFELSWEESKGDELDKAWGRNGNIPAGKVQVPRAPFLRWAFAKMKMYEDFLQPWQNVCPSGMKMPLDNQDHTDWVVGAGLDPANRELLYYPSPLADAAMNKVRDLQNEFSEAGRGITVLVDGPWASGRVVHGKPNLPSEEGSVVVLPNLHPKYLVSTAHACAVITEEGGATAHLAQIGRDRLLPMVRISGALEKYTEGVEVIVDTANRKVQEV